MRSALPADPGVEPTHRVPTTLVLSLAALGSALVATFGENDSFSSLTVAAALVGLVPWALVAGGVRVRPLLFAAMTLSCAGVITVVGANAGGMFPVMLMLVWVARASGDWRVHAGALTSSLGLLVATAVRLESAHEAGLVYFAGGVGISWLAGLMLRRQESLTLELAAMTELRVEHAASAERARIARDVHDVVAHSLTVVMLHLTGARRAMSTEPARAEEALARAEIVGRESLESIRQVMGVLREPQHDGRAPDPGLADVTALIDGYRLGGLVVDADVDPTVDVDRAVGVAIYRIVQESLTNALRHAPGAPCTIAVGAPPAGPLTVEVSNGLRTVGTAMPAVPRQGLGIRGMTERVRAVGGELVAGPAPDGGWRVRATIPHRLTRTDGDRGDGAVDSERAWSQPTGR